MYLILNLERCSTRIRIQYMGSVWNIHRQGFKLTCLRIPMNTRNRYPYTDSDSPVPSSFHCPPCVHRIYSPGSHAEFSNRGQGRFVLDDNNVLFVIFLLSCVNSNTGNQTTHFKSCVDDIKVCGVVAKCERTVNLLLIGSNEMIWYDFSVLEAFVLKFYLITLPYSCSKTQLNADIWQIFWQNRQERG